MPPKRNAMSLIVILFSLIFLVISGRQFQSYMNPTSMFVAVWAIAQTYLMLDSRFAAISVEAQVIFVGAGLLFWLGAITAQALGPSSRLGIRGHQIAEPVHSNVRIIYGALFAVLLVGGIIYIIPYWGIFQGFDSLAGYVGYIRRSALHGGLITYDVPLVGQVPLISGIFSMFLAAHYAETREKYVGRYLLLVLIIMIVSGGAAGARSLFMRFLAGVCIVFLFSGRFSGRSMNIRVALIFGGVVFLFVSLGALRSGNDFNALLLTFSQGFTAIVKYLFGSLVLFSERLDDIEGVYSTHFTYGWIANLSGTDLEDLSVLYTPYGHPDLGVGNTYTIMGPLINDYGIFGALLWFYILGLITSFFFVRIKKNYFYFVCYCLLASSIFFSVFSEYFITTVPLYPRVFLIYLLIAKGPKILAELGLGKVRRQMHLQ